MKKQVIPDFLRRGDVLAIFVIAMGALMAAVIGIRLSSITIQSGAQAQMYTTPTHDVVAPHSTLTVRVMVSATVPVNAFQGEIQFDPTTLAIKKIDYNTSIADLWAKKPWYSNGAGTINFAGGTTHSGGFIGSGALMKITFTTLKPGTGNISISNARILKANGLGTDVKLGKSLDSIVTIKDPTQVTPVFATTTVTNTTYTVASSTPVGDLTGDGVMNLADLSRFMSDLVTQNKEADLNGDGDVDMHDLSILMQHVH